MSSFDNKNIHTNENEEVKEQFCGACLAVPAALAGAGIAGASTQQKGEYKKRQKIMLWSGIAIVIISAIIGIWFALSCKKCKAK